jgi:hypothetical protein
MWPTPGIAAPDSLLRSQLWLIPFVVTLVFAEDLAFLSMPIIRRLGILSITASNSFSDAGFAYFGDFREGGSRGCAMRCSSAPGRCFIQQYGDHYRQCAQNQHYDGDFHGCSHLVRRTARGRWRRRQEVETRAPAKPPRVGQSRRGQAASAHQDSSNFRKSDPMRTRSLVPSSQYALQNLKAHLSSACFLTVRWFKSRAGECLDEA